MIFSPRSEIKEIEIQLEDTNLRTRRQILFHEMNDEGPLITYSNTNKVLHMYTVELYKEVFVEEDLTKNCINYPTDLYNSYNDCDWQFGRTRLAKEVGPDFTPLWATDNMTSVTGEPVFLKSAKAQFTHMNLGNGLQLSDCKVPCVVMKTKSKYQGSVKTKYEGVSLSFKEDIQVTTTSFVPFNTVKFLCDIGGMLGLWLGLGAVQLGELVIHTIQLSLKKCKKTE